MGRKKEDVLPVTDKTSIEIGVGYIGVKTREESMLWRVAESNRLRDMIRRKVEGISFDAPEQKKTKEQKDADKEKYKDENLPGFLDDLKKNGKLTSKELVRINTVKDIINDIKKLEERATKELVEPYVVNEEMWYAYYEHIKGMGPINAAALIQTVQPHGIKTDGTEICPHPSSLRRYCMMDPDGAEGRKKGKKLTGNIQAKTLWWKIGKQMMMAKNPTFMRLYEAEKARQLAVMATSSCKNCGKRSDEHTRKKDDTYYRCKDGKKYDPVVLTAPMCLGHAHNRAIRNTLQKYITWHWIIDRQLNGFPTDQGYIFTVAPNPHALAGFIEPEYIPDILKDENGQWDSARPAGWIFQVGHKDWKDAPEYVKNLCGMQGSYTSTAKIVKIEDDKKSEEIIAILGKITQATLNGTTPELTEDERAILRNWQTSQKQANKKQAVAEVKKGRGRPPKTLAEAQENPIEAMKMLQQKETTTGSPKKRGRPRKEPETKSEVIKKAAEEKGIPVTNMPIEKKKRGRPRKEPIATTETPVKRKRGRPRKEA